MYACHGDRYCAKVVFRSFSNLDIEISEKDKTFYFFKSLINTKVKVKVNMLLHMNLNENMPWLETYI